MIFTYTHTIAVDNGNESSFHEFSGMFCTKASCLKSWGSSCRYRQYLSVWDPSLGYVHASRPHKKSFSDDATMFQINCTARWLQQIKNTVCRFIWYWWINRLMICRIIHKMTNRRGALGHYLLRIKLLSSLAF